MSKKGFTLVELMVVFSVLAIFSFASLQTFYRFSAQLSLGAAARSLAAEMRGIQSRAITQHKTLSLNPSEITLPPGVKAAKTSTISFASTGFTKPGGSGTFIIENRLGQQRKIIVSSAGRVRIE